MDANPTLLEQLQADLKASGLGDVDVVRRSRELDVYVSPRTMYAFRRAVPGKGPQPSGRTLNNVWVVLRDAAKAEAARAEAA